MKSFRLDRLRKLTDSEVKFLKSKFGAQVSTEVEGITTQGILIGFWNLDGKYEYSQIRPRSQPVLYPLVIFNTELGYYATDNVEFV